MVIFVDLVVESIYEMHTMPIFMNTSTTAGNRYAVELCVSNIDVSNTAYLQLHKNEESVVQSSCIFGY